MVQKRISAALIFALLCFMGRSQDVAINDVEEITYARAFDLAYDGDHKTSHGVLVQLLEKKPNNLEARSLLASTLSWKGKYAAARKEFNKVISLERNNSELWISAIKNELYAKNSATALGLANKALFYLKKDPEVERLRQVALNRIKEQKYPELGWFNKDSGLKTSFRPTKKTKRKKRSEKKRKIRQAQKLRMMKTRKKKQARRSSETDFLSEIRLLFSTNATNR